MFKKLSLESWIKFATGFYKGDIGIVSDIGIVGSLIVFGTDNGDSFKACHALTYAGDGIGLIIESDGKNTCGKHLINDYMKKVMEGKVRMQVFRPKGGITPDEINRIETFWELHKDGRYNWWTNFWFGAWGIVNKINRPFGSWLSSLKNPAYKDGSSTVCSQTAVLQFKGGDNRLYNPIVAKCPIENLTPEELHSAITTAFDLVMDTETL
jgi:hypothetical protein